MIRITVGNQSVLPFSYRLSTYKISSKHIYNFYPGNRHIQKDRLSHNLLHCRR